MKFLAFPSVRVRAEMRRVLGRTRLCDVFVEQDGLARAHIHQIRVPASFGAVTVWLRVRNVVLS